MRPLPQAFEAQALAEGAKLMGVDPVAMVLGGGEDYELCFTTPPGCREKIIAIMKKCGVGATPVGIVTSSPGVTAVSVSGAGSYSAHQTGFNHFIP